MGALETNTTLIYGVHIRESANDGSDFTNAASDYRVLYLGEDGYLHVKDSAGVVTEPVNPSAGASYGSFTPTLGATTTPPTLGSGSSVVGSYAADGKFVNGHAVIIFGTSGTAAGSGAYQVLLPVAVAFPAGANSMMVGQFYVFDGTSTERTGIIRVQPGAPTLGLLTFPASGANANVTNTVPWAWGASDQIAYSFAYKSV
jgi:hypothetical protein